VITRFRVSPEGFCRAHETKTWALKRVAFVIPVVYLYVNFRIDRMTCCEELLYCSGKMRRIFFARSSNGDIPAKEFLDSAKRGSVATWGKLDRILKRLSDFGQIRNKEQFRPVGDDLWEVKEGGGKRLVGYFSYSHFILTHGFEKRGGGKASNKFPPTERERALRIKSEFEMELTRMIRGR